ncbi:hypothetical protein K435DRAFT_863028 [Dendrothele bispora CBS 962.96]|uniref:Uncharacterized protein n=1 Tax=Dendrothele bispora (strain CBS 962.96) TaxID=1314807 RepID=A0A4S8LS72_DENBC|nr:hypothetical protein K435DRAFT_863028 [Dendrothele bispora CBS 962.96]
MPVFSNMVKFCVIELTPDTDMRKAHKEFAIASRRSIEIASILPTGVATAMDALRIGQIDGIIVSRNLVGTLNLDNVESDAAAEAVDAYNLIRLSGSNLCAVNIDVFGIHYAMTASSAYPRFRAALVIGTGPLVRAAIYCLAQYFQSYVFYIFEESDETFTHFEKKIHEMDNGITVVRHTDVTSSPAVSCVVTDVPKDLQSGERTDNFRSLLSVTFHTHRLYFGIDQKNIFLNLGYSISGMDLTPWSFLALRDGWEEILSDVLEKFQTQIIWQQVASSENNFNFIYTRCVTSFASAMAQPESLICVIVDLTDNWSLRVSIPFARTYNHAYTVDDLLLDQWLSPASDSLIRPGLSLRRLFCTRWRLGRDTSLLPNPYTLLFEDNTLDLQTGVIAAIKHADAGPDTSFMIDCNEEDIGIVERVIMNYRAYKLRISNTVKRYSYLVGDRRFATGTNDIIRVDSRVPIEPGSGYMTTLATFSTTCRNHYTRIVHFMDYRVNKVIRKLTVPGFIDLVDIKEALRASNAIIHGLAALLPLLPDEIAVPNNIEIATPLGTRKFWIELFARVPNLPAYHLWDDNISIGTLQLVRVRGIFFLPNNVVVTVQESFFDSAIPVMLSHPTTAMCCGISHGIVFTMYPYHIKNRITDRVFEKYHPPRWYMNRLMKPVSFACYPVTDYDFHTIPRPDYKPRDCPMIWRRTSGCHGMGSLRWSAIDPAERPGIPWGVSHLHNMSKNSFAITGRIRAIFLLGGGTTDVNPIPTLLTDADRTQVDRRSTYHVVELVPDEDNKTSFLEVLISLKDALEGIKLPPTWNLAEYHDQELPAPPIPNFVDSAGIYTHWDHNRKAITLNAVVTIHFHLIRERSIGNMLVPLAIAERLTVIQNGHNWYDMKERSDDKNRWMVFEPIVIPSEFT